MKRINNYFWARLERTKELLQDLQELQCKTRLTTKDQMQYEIKKANVKVRIRTLAKYHRFW